MTNVIVLSTRAKAGVVDALTNVDIQSVLLLFLDDQLYVCIVQTASTGFEQIAQS